MKPLLLLITAISVEVGATTLLKLSDGFSKLTPALFSLTGYCISLWLMSLCLKSLDVGFVYAIWSGLGTVGVVIIGILVFNESLDATRVIGIALIVAGVVVLNIGSKVPVH